MQKKRLIGLDSTNILKDYFGELFKETNTEIMIAARHGVLIGVSYDASRLEQIFDAYKFATDLIRTAKKSILLIDNYVDDSVLLMLSKRDTGVVATIYTHGISNQLNLDIQKYNSQYPRIDVRTFKQSHDRFLIIDNAEVYHIGASLKDLGKKMFAFSKLDIPPQTITDLL